MDQNIKIEVLLHYHTIFCDDRMSISMVNRWLNMMTWLRQQGSKHAALLVLPLLKLLIILSR